MRYDCLSVSSGLIDLNLILILAAPFLYVFEHESLQLGLIPGALRW